LTVDPGFVAVKFTISLSGNAIAWTPSKYGILILRAFSASGLKWEISVPFGKVIASPITYGVVPAGAKQTYPPRGTPEPLVPGDTISIDSGGGSVDGLPYIGSGDFTIPE